MSRSPGRSRRAAPVTHVLCVLGVAALLGSLEPTAAVADPGALDVPPGCALGIGGPALREATSLREARDAAFAALAAEQGPTEVTSEIAWRDAQMREVATERVSGVLRGVYIAALRRHGEGRIDVVACGPKAAPPARARRSPGVRPIWPRPLPRRRDCALGVAGVDLSAQRRTASARRDALEMLARRFEAQVDHSLTLHGGRRLDRTHAVRATPDARARVEARAGDLVESQWLDERGRGPLGLPGLLYLQICLPSD